MLTFCQIKTLEFVLHGTLTLPCEDKHTTKVLCVKVSKNLLKFISFEVLKNEVAENILLNPLASHYLENTAQKRVYVFFSPQSMLMKCIRYLVFEINQLVEKQRARTIELNLIFMLKKNNNTSKDTDYAKDPQHPNDRIIMPNDDYFAAEIFHVPFCSQRTEPLKWLYLICISKPVTAAINSILRAMC